jgi:protein TonB
VIQAAVLAALVLVPFLATGEKLSLVSVTPVPPFYGVPQTTRRPNSHPASAHHATNGTIYDATRPPSRIPPQIATKDSVADGPVPPNVLGGTPGIGQRWGVDYLDTHRPGPPVTAVAPPRKAVFSHMDPAMLIHRVEPVYPVLARMARREGRVELRATISTDGSISSLEVLSGDPLFVRASYDAVQQWRYRPLILNGQAVEVETYITVVFMLQH